MKQGGAPPRKRKRREAAAETETEAEHPDMSTVMEAEHPDLSTVTEAERRSPRCWLLALQYSSAVRSYSCTRAPAAELYESCAVRLYSYSY
eukprot:COSAG01_NODE_1896_length_8969_cov_35.725028_16_plen_91_part_00